MRLDMFFDVSGQRPVVSAKRRHLAVDTTVYEDAVVPLPAGDKCVIITTAGEGASVAPLIMLLTEDGLPILTEDGEPLLTEDSGNPVLPEPDGSTVFPARDLLRALSVSVPESSSIRVTVIQ